ncbi:hypothetical protein BDC45DRAFT_541323 [Circinella umbellata]|nr:hypothetical protein BDC45DRAFT_541323 [Circinella umbellata]
MTHESTENQMSIQYQEHSCFWRILIVRDECLIKLKIFRYSNIRIDRYVAIQNIFINLNFLFVTNVAISKGWFKPSNSKQKIKITNFNRPKNLSMHLSDYDGFNPDPRWNPLLNFESNTLQHLTFDTHTYPNVVTSMLRKCPSICRHKISN